ncbi:hypothetical protein CBR_g46185 [Chara braunii]|uniref:BZIP domain-containing protein n=1 Tax=Chara braunii TaxID=69332 RepID=A0A388M042_CHABU|nr:hypothetical protein CBR_g46185 [Chara braunii]|eukprot:GBG87885.1 hypothetical protein CBR_g46185 [Chara braunii]
MCRPPEPCIPKPPSAYARRYECPKLVLTAVYGGGYQYQPYISPSACEDSHVGTEDDPSGNLNGELRYERRHSGGYHDDGCRPSQHQRQREFSASSPNLYGAISSTELLDVLARRGLYNFSEERSTSFSSSYQSSSPPFTPMVVAGPAASPSGISSCNARDVDGALYASNSSVAAVILGSDGGGTAAAANCPPSDVLVGTESGQSCDVQTSDSGALTVATDKSRKRARINCMLSSSSQLRTQSSRPAFVARTVESSSEDEVAHNGAKKGCHAGAVACFTGDGRGKYLFNSVQHDVSSAGACFGYCADHSVPRQQYHPSEFAGMPTTLAITQPQPATLPVVSSLVPSLGGASAVATVTVTMGALTRNMPANSAAGERVVGSRAEGISSLGSDCTANALKGAVGLPVHATTTATFSPSVAVVVGNCVPLAESEKAWMPTSTGTQRDLDNWIEEFLTSDPLPESMMDSLDCEFQPTDITDVCEAGVVVRTGTATPASDVSGSAVSIAKAGNSLSLKNVDQIEPVSAAGVGDKSIGICPLRRNRREEDAQNSDVPLESLTDEEKKGDSSSLLTRSASEHIGLPDKKTKRMLSNRESARRSRQRRQELMDTLELEAARLRVENAALVRHARETAKTLEECKLKNNSLNEELKTLRRKLCFYESPTVAGKAAGGWGADSVQERVGGGVMSVLFPAGEGMCVAEDLEQKGKQWPDCSSHAFQDAEEKGCGEEANKGRCAKKSRTGGASGYAAAGLNGDCHSIGREVNCASLSGGSGLTSSQLSPTNSSDDEGEGRIATCYSAWYKCDQFSDMVNMSKNDDENVLDIGQDVAAKEPIWTRSEGGSLPVVKAH